MRHVLVCLTAVFCTFLSTAFADDGATFIVKDGAAPWNDRVGQWELGDVPASLKSDEPILQQSCSSRALTVTGKPSSITVGIVESDVARFKELFPNAKETGDKLTVRHPDGSASLPYVVVTLSNPPESISGGDTPFGAGLLLLKTQNGATTQPSTKTE